MVGGDFMIVFEELEFCGLLHETLNPYDSFELAIKINFKKGGDVDAMIWFTC
jgi:hypothetical protein